MPKIFFDNEDFDGQFLRTLSYAAYGGADIGECFERASRIEEGNRDSWYEAFTKTADRLREEAEERPPWSQLDQLRYDQPHDQALLVARLENEVELPGEELTRKNAILMNTKAGAVRQLTTTSGAWQGATEPRESSEMASGTAERAEKEPRPATEGAREPSKGRRWPWRKRWFG
jgi:hypothetical protein